MQQRFNSRQSPHFHKITESQNILSWKWHTGMTESNSQERFLIQIFVGPFLFSTQDLIELKKKTVSQAVGFLACKKPVFLAQRTHCVANKGEFWIISYPNLSSSRAAQPVFSSVMADIPSVLTLVMCNIFTVKFLMFSRFFKQAWDSDGRTKWSFPHLNHVFSFHGWPNENTPCAVSKAMEFL